MKDLPQLYVKIKPGLLVLGRSILLVFIFLEFLVYCKCFYLLKNRFLDLCFSF